MTSVASEPPPLVEDHALIKVCVAEYRSEKKFLQDKQD
jgi:hypothetical protein